MHSHWQHKPLLHIITREGNYTQFCAPLRWEELILGKLGKLRKICGKIAILGVCTLLLEGNDSEKFHYFCHIATLAWACYSCGFPSKRSKNMVWEHAVVWKHKKMNYNLVSKNYASIQEAEFFVEIIFTAEVGKNLKRRGRNRRILPKFAKLGRFWQICNKLAKKNAPGHLRFMQKHRRRKWKIVRKRKLRKVWKSAEIEENCGICGKCGYNTPWLLASCCSMPYGIRCLAHCHRSHHHLAFGLRNSAVHGTVKLDFS